MDPAQFLCRLLLAVGFSLALSNACLASTLDDAKQDMAYSRYNAASTGFQKVLQSDPNNASVHFLLGQCFERLLDPESAKAEYEIVFKLNPFNDQGRQAREALLNLSSNQAVKAHGPVDTPQMYDQSLREITRQSEDIKRRYQAEGQRGADYRTRLATIEARKAGYQGRTVNRGGLLNTPEISGWGALNSSYIRYDGATQSTRYLIEASKHAFETQSAANNLKSLLADHSKFGSNPKLRALGTNLYVRNYHTNDYDELPASDPVLELKAHEDSILDLPTELHATAVSWPEQSISVSKSVFHY